MERLISVLGLFVMVFLAWLMSSNKRKMNWRIIIGGMLLQFGFALLVLKTSAGRAFFDKIGDVFNALISCVGKGTEFMFAMGLETTSTQGRTLQMITSFAFGVLPTIVFFSALMSILYYIGVMQWVVAGVAWAMQKTLRTSGAETLSASANIFVGQTEAPLVIKPYVPEMTKSELMAVMVGGFATVAGGVMAAYVGMGISAGHLVTASVISAPAALLIAKILQPEVEEPKTAGKLDVRTEQVAVNLVDAAAIGAADGMKLAINVGAMLIAFIALIAMFDGILGWTGGRIGHWFGYEWHWSLEAMMGYLFAPFAWLMGIENQDCLPAGELLGIRLAGNEFIAYQRLGEMIKPESAVHLSDRTKVIMTYALCGFANFSSIGIQIGGIGGIAPDRRHDLARLGMRAMFGGLLACFMTACVAGILNPPWKDVTQGNAPVKQSSEETKPGDGQPTESPPAESKPNDAALLESTAWRDDRICHVIRQRGANGAIVASDLYLIHKSDSPKMVVRRVGRCNSYS
jgi:concentrative nucleoside transporter, CNT family